MKTSPKKNLFILIPGNPGMSYAYDNFIYSLKKTHKEDFFYCHQHLGQGTNDDFFPSLTIEDLINDHSEFIERKLKQHKDHNLILIGHSLGGLLSLEIFQRKLFPIHKAVLLCPFIELSFPNIWFVKGLKQKGFQKGLKHFVNIVGKSPNPIKKPIQKLFNLGDYGEQIFEDFTRENFKYNFFSLLQRYPRHYEKLNLIHWLRTEATQEEKEKLFFIFANKDPWSPKTLYQKLPPSVPKVFDRRFRHNFCLDSWQCNIMASLINKRLFNF